MMKHSRFIFWGILLLGFVLRLINIEGHSIQYDDAFSILLSQRSLPEIVSGTAADTMPPLYYFLLHFWMQISQDLWWLRLLSVILSLAIVVVTYHLVKELEGRPAGWWAALFIAISPIHNFHARDLRMYALLALAQISYLYYFCRIWRRKDQRNHWGNWSGVLICGILAMYSHNLAIFGLVVLDIFLLLQREWRLLLKLLITQFLIGLFTLPWLVVIPEQIEKIQRAFWTARPGLVEIFQSIIMVTTDLPLPGLWLVIGAVLSLQILILIILEIWQYLKSTRNSCYLIAIAVLPPMLLFIASYLMRPVFVPRGFLVASIGYLGIGGVLAAHRWNKGAGKLIAAGFIICASIGLPYQAWFNEFPYSQFRETTSYLASVYQPGDRIIHDNKLSYFPSRYYAPNLDQLFLADEPGGHNDTLAIATQQAMEISPQKDLETAVDNVDRVYFVVFTKTIEEYTLDAKQDHPNLIWLQERYGQANKMVFKDLEVYRFER